MDSTELTRVGRCSVCGVVLNITYGHKVESIADSLVVNGDKATSNTVNIGGPGSLLVDLIPIRMCDMSLFNPDLQLILDMPGVVKHWPTWMPFSDFKKHAVYTRALVDDLMNTPYNWVKGRMVRPIIHFVGCFPVDRRSRSCFRPLERQRLVSRSSYSRLWEPKSDLIESQRPSTKRISRE